MTTTIREAKNGRPASQRSASATDLVLATASQDYPVNMTAFRRGLDGAAEARAVALPPGPMSPEEEDQAAEILGQAAGILLRVGYLGPRLLTRLARLRVVTLHGTGVDQVDVNACRSNGVVVTNVPGANAAAVAELTIGLILSMLRRIPYADSHLRSGNWAAGRVPGEELSGKVVGVIGYGRIGRRVAALARAFGARVIVHSRSPVPDETCVTIEDLLNSSDIVTLHLPLAPDTSGMLNAVRIGQMKRGSILINTARGALVDESALAAALESGHLAGAALDVFASEPPDPLNPLLHLPNVLVTPHVGSSTTQALESIARLAGEDMGRVLRGEAPQHPV